jgi:predicted RND superfamily exporter protein
MCIRDRNDGDPAFYRLPNALNMGDIAGRMPQANPAAGSMQNAIVRGLMDSTRTTLRISYQVKDVGSIRLDSINKEVYKILDRIFPPEEYTTQITGSSAVFLKGNSYLYGSLGSATFWSLLIITITMGFLFPSIRMIIIAVIPNIIPLLVTAGTMGYFDVPLKPSTILVFSIAFGITVDATIHFIITFRRELVKHNRPVREALNETIVEVGVSMIYSMVAICAGFLIFTFSSFQGTQALGWLTGLTLLTGMAANLFLLPALILSLEKSLNPKEELSEQVLELPDENED